MKYIDGMAIGVTTILAVLYAEYANAPLPMWLAIGVCAGVAIDWALRAVIKAVKRG